MPFMFNTILLSAGFRLEDVRLVRHKDKRADKGRSPYELWRDDRQRFDVYQSTQSLKNKSKLDAPYWAAFVGTNSGETLFVGVYRAENRRLLEKDTPDPGMDGVMKAGSCHFYDLTLDQKLSDMVGKLTIDWGSGYRSWIQRADRQDKRVVGVPPEFKTPKTQADGSTGIGAQIRGYLPTKVDCERAIQELNRIKAIEKIRDEDVLDRLEADFSSKGLTLKDNWRLITKENFKVWF